MTYLPVGFDKSKIETLFIENNQTLDGHQNLLEHFLQESTEKIRKRALISSTFATALRAKHVIKIFKHLR